MPVLIVKIPEMFYGTIIKLQQCLFFQDFICTHILREKPIFILLHTNTTYLFLIIFDLKFHQVSSFLENIVELKKGGGRFDMSF